MTKKGAQAPFLYLGRTVYCGNMSIKERQYNQTTIQIKIRTYTNSIKLVSLKKASAIDLIA